MADSGHRSFPQKDKLLLRFGAVLNQFHEKTFKYIDTVLYSELGDIHAD